MSLTALTRNGPLSRFTNRFPNPAEPRILGAKTEILRQQSLVFAREPGPFLTFRPPVETQYDGAGVGNTGRPVEPAGQFEAVVGLETNKLGTHQTGQIDPRMWTLRNRA